jgi:hypothetical protein
MNVAAHISIVNQHDHAASVVQVEFQSILRRRIMNLEAGVCDGNQSQARDRGGSPRSNLRTRLQPTQSQLSCWGSVCESR